MAIPYDKLINYSWWNGKNPPLEHLRTKKQLSAMGLKPGNPVGIIKGRYYNVFLYDPEQCPPKRKCSAKQLEHIHAMVEKKKLKEDIYKWVEQLPNFYDRSLAILKARELYQRNVYILDTETTSLENEVIKLTIIDCQGNVLFDQLIKPTTQISYGAYEVHGINEKMLVNCPTFQDVYPVIKSICQQNLVTSYNWEFDYRILVRSAKNWGLPILPVQGVLDCVCLMKLYSQYVNKKHPYFGDYVFQPLNGEHRALSDCLKALEFLKKMASDSEFIPYPFPKESVSMIPDDLHESENFRRFVDV